jgi:hemoglobin
MVDSFYAKVNKDDLLSPVFNNFAQVHWESHLPKMYQFWDSILFGTASYKGRPFPKHMPLPINETHFERWVSLFITNVDEQFAGIRADEAKNRAKTIAVIFQNKLRIMNRL